MKKIQSSILGEIKLDGKEIGIYDIEVDFLDYNVSSFYISEDTVKDHKASKKFLDWLENIEEIYNNSKRILLEQEDSEIDDYFDFYMEEVPEVFSIENPQNLTKKEKIDKLFLKGISTHSDDITQAFVVDFSLGYDQLLCVNFDSTFNFNSISWES